MVVSVVCVSGDFNVFLPLSGKKKLIPLYMVTQSPSQFKPQNAIK